MTDIETLRWTAREILPIRQSEWLDRAVDTLRVDFAQIGETFTDNITIFSQYPEGNERLSDGWLGQYFATGCPTSENLHHSWILINPTVNGLLALDILVHELVHAVAGIIEELPSGRWDNHGPRFHVVAAAIGMDDTGPTAGAKKELLRRLREVQESLGPYPVIFDCLETV